MGRENTNQKKWPIHKNGLGCNGQCKGLGVCQKEKIDGLMDLPQDGLDWMVYPLFYIALASLFSFVGVF